MTDRPRQTNCQHEPPYPDDATVLVSLAYPDCCAHHPTSRCAIEEPHAIVRCGEFMRADEWSRWLRVEQRMLAVHVPPATYVEPTIV